MRINQVYVEYGETRTVNFQACKIMVGLGAGVTEGELHEDVQKILEDKCRQAIEAAYARYSARQAQKLIDKIEKGEGN